MEIARAISACLDAGQPHQPDLAAEESQHARIGGHR